MSHLFVSSISLTLISGLSLLHLSSISLFKKYPNYTDRVAAVLQLGIPIISQPQKQTGFEKIKEYYDDQPARVNPREKLKYSNKPSKRVFDILFRYRLTDKIKYQDQIVFTQ